MSKNLNPNSKKCARAEKKIEKQLVANNLIDGTSSDEERNRSAAGKSTLTARPGRTTSGAKKPRLDGGNNMDSTLEVASSSSSPSPPVVNTVSSPETAAAPVLTVAHNTIPPIAVSSNLIDVTE